MKAKELIKEIDPDYVICGWCKRLIHKDKLETYAIPNTGFERNDAFQCKDRLECFTFRWLEHDRREFNQRTRSRIP